MIDELKGFVRDTVGLPPAAILIGAGLLAHMACNLALQKPITSAYGLILPLVLGVSLETYEIWVQYRDVGLLAEGNDPLITILARHALDVLIVVAAPAALVAYGLATR